VPPSIPPPAGLRTLHPGERRDRVFRGTPLVYYAPGITPADARCNAVYREWDALIAHLQERHSDQDQATVAVFPCGAIQLAAESVAT
jgi:hypothetical protein